MQVTKEMLIKQIFTLFPEKTEKIVAFFGKLGIQCISCCAAAWESLEDGLRNHGKTYSEIEEIIKEINKIINT